MRALLLALLLGGFGVHAETLYMYEVHVGTPKYSEGHMDHFTQALVRVLKETGNGDGCLDVRRLYQFKMPPIESLGIKLKVINVLHLLTNRKLEPFPVEELRAALCEGLDERCDIREYMAEADVSQLTLSRVYRSGPWLADSRPTKSKKVAMPQMTAFPRFSSSCETGKTDESIFFSARTAESREFLKAAGIPIEDTIAVRLGQGKAGFWGFGSPDPNWTSAPVNNQDGPLVPPSILDDLQ